MLWSLGVYGVLFRKWKTEPGLWMLATFLFLSLGSCSAYPEYRHWSAVLEGIRKGGLRGPARLGEIKTSIDAGVALAIPAQSVRLGMTVSTENWNRNAW